jgi:hypothetical protein
MNGHLSDFDLRQFVQGTMPPSGLLAADDHLAACHECRARAARIGAAASQLRDLQVRLIPVEGHHLSDEDIQDHLAARMPPERRREVERHLQACESCLDAVRDAWQWKTSAPARGRPWMYLGAAAAVVLLVLMPWLVRRGPEERRREAAPSIAGMELLSVDEQSEVAAALRAGVAEPPAVLAELSADADVLMGAAPREMLRLIAPLGTVTVSDQPTFRWDPLPGTTAYSVAIFDDRLGQVAGVSQTSAGSWTPDQPLARGQLYSWQVTAERASESITAPVAPEPPARFAVMDPSSAANFERLLSARPDAHLLLGILAARAGARDEAEQHLGQVAQDDAHSALARRTLERVRRSPP